MTDLRASSLCHLLLLLLLTEQGLTLPSPSAAGGRQIQDVWQQWKTRYSKTYPDAYHEARAQALWLRHWHLVQSHMSRPDVTYTLEVNAFADQEFTHAKEVQKSPLLQYVPEVKTEFLPPAHPASFDWRSKGVISPVRNQGQMGRADPIAVTEDLESLHAIRTGELVRLSVTEVTDCCSAASGLLVSDIYECIARHGGLCSEASYPAHPPPPVCHNNSCQAVAKDAHVTVHVPERNESAMMSAVLRCPLVVFVDASHASFQLYKSGVYSDPQCGHSLDHVLQLVGYGTLDGHPYWILKNSWGADWGMQGYMLMERGVNRCGIADHAFYPQ